MMVFICADVFFFPVWNWSKQNIVARKRKHITSTWLSMCFLLNSCLFNDSVLLFYTCSNILRCSKVIRLLMAFSFSCFLWQSQGALFTLSAGLFLVLLPANQSFLPACAERWLHNMYLWSLHPISCHAKFQVDSWFLSRKLSQSRCCADHVFTHLCESLSNMIREH